ncbi:hypothetical protein L596_026558 [Steinernema carpocapsae]|uniref:Uncharacterized protein n=1 Tax=Steinernema carpocapsae TaxID=34508 RepID=A0A4U5M1Q8_STECR|nr:hypothetical protein L596_026558 [Steinernema carpocapsae]
MVFTTREEPIVQIHSLSDISAYASQPLPGILSIDYAFLWGYSEKAANLFPILPLQFSKIHFNFASLHSNALPLPVYFRQFLIQQLHSSVLSDLTCHIENELYIDEALFKFCTSTLFEKLEWNATSSLSAALVTSIFEFWTTQAWEDAQHDRTLKIYFVKDNCEHLINFLKLVKEEVIGEETYETVLTYSTTAINESDLKKQVKMELMRREYNHCLTMTLRNMK